MPYIVEVSQWDDVSGSGDVLGGNLAQCLGWIKGGDVG